MKKELDVPFQVLWLLKIDLRHYRRYCPGILRLEVCRPQKHLQSKAMQIRSRLCRLAQGEA